MKMAFVMKIRLCVRGAGFNYAEAFCKAEGFPKEGWEFVNGKHWLVLPGTSKSWIGRPTTSEFQVQRASSSEE